MNWLWDLLGNYPWLTLVLLGVVGQLFTPNPKKRQEARERERKRRMQMPKGADKPRTEADEVAERIRELFMGKPEEVGTPQRDQERDQEREQEREQVAPQTFAESRTLPTPEPAPRHVPRERITRLVSAHDVTASHAYDLQVQTRAAFSLDPRAAIRAMIVLGPPRALASYDQDPLLSLHQRRV